MRFTLLSSAAFCGLFLSVAAVPLNVPRGHGPGYPDDVSAHGAGSPAPAPAPAPVAGAGAPGTVNEIPTGVGADGRPCGGRSPDGLVKGLLDGVNTVLCEGGPETVGDAVPKVVDSVGNIL